MVATDKGPGNTVSAVLLVTDPWLAVIVELPPATAVASPAELIVTAAVFEEDQVTCVVMSCVVLSLYVPVAVNCWVAPAFMVVFAGVTVMELNAPVAAGVNATSTQ